MSQLFTSGGQSIAASASVLPMISLRIDWFNLLAIQGTLKSLLHYHSSKASVLQHSDFFMIQLSYSYMTTGKTIALPRWTFVGKVMSLLFNMLSRLVMTFLPRSKHLLISIERGRRECGKPHKTGRSQRRRRKGNRKESELNGDGCEKGEREPGR